MNIYTAAKFELADEQREYNDVISSLGHHITQDWTRWEGDGDMTPERRRMAAMLDYAGVMQADLLIFWDKMGGNGARWECGMAAARGIPIWIVEYSHTVIFDMLPQVRIVEDWDLALSLLNRLGTFA